MGPCWTAGNVCPRNKEALIKCAVNSDRANNWKAVNGIMEEIRMLPGVNYAITANGGTVADLENAGCLLRRT